MVELHDSGSRQLRLGYGGDVLNTLVYAQRSGVQSAFATVTGDDHYGRWLRSNWETEGIDCKLVRHDANTSPALHIIRNEPSGERNFHYWRDASPFKALLDVDGYVAALSEAMEAVPWVYVSGIALAMLDDESRARLIAMLEAARGRGARTAFDPNYRARLWADSATAQHWLSRAYSCATVALPSLEDEQALRQAEIDGEALAKDLSALGVEEVVVKDGPRGSQVYSGQRCERVAAVDVAQVIDTTAAGDAFNGAYLAARIQGETALEAAAAGARLAAYVVQHPGAIAPA
ncbi:MAG: sugar kinase [Pseudomonadales bacterium]